jgi:hypothetical protein
MWGIAAILVAFILFVYFFNRLRTAKPVVDTALSLSDRPQVASAEATKQLLNATNTGTIQAFVYPLQAQKTGTVVLCNPSGSANPGEPNCSSGEYNLCKCVGNDCSKCIHSGYVNILNISNVIRLELLAAPDASRQRAAGAQLVVRTLGMSSPLVNNQPDPSAPRTESVFEETIPLPNIPFQKWTFVTIAREGRRFDVYYNGKLVMSKRTQNVVDVRSAFGPIVGGDPSLKGTITRVESFSEKLTQPQIEAKYKEQADTTGQPHMASTLNVFDYIPNCKGGGCLTGPSVRPTSPLLDWETPYA